jgi:hypothetical protein
MALNKPVRLVLVQFPTEEHSPVAVIPFSWTTDDHQYCMWPPRLLNQTRLAEREAVPKQGWTKERISILKYCGKLYLIM